MDWHAAGQFLYHWVYRDVWVLVWPNWAADVILGLIIYFVGRNKLKSFNKKLERNHVDMKNYIDDSLKDVIAKKPSIHKPNIHKPSLRKKK